MTFDPLTYFDPQALVRRHRENLPLSDSTDFPLNTSYTELVRQTNAVIEGESRWINALVCRLTPDQRLAIAAMPFVTEVSPVFSHAMQPCGMEIGPYDSQLMKAQTKFMGYSAFADQQLNGKGVTIAVFDAGFQGLVDNPHFQHLIDHKQIKSTFNFVTNRNFVFDYHSHGTMVMSCMAGLVDQEPLGCASGAHYLLARTEQTKSESLIEEDHWIRSLEWADQQGADIVNSSLGYTHQLYQRKDMTGHGHLMAKAANTAFGKGILIVNSAGNEGEAWWEIVAGPADADSILTVGGIDPLSGIHHPMSSFGPNVSGQLKPNVSAFFSAIVSVDGKLKKAEGTSFSSPLVAGFAACVWQLHPDWNVRQVFGEIQKSAHLYPYYDYAHGYGVPQASYFTDSALVATKRFDLFYESAEDQYVLQLCEPSTDLSIFESEPLKNPKDYVYYQLCDSLGQITSYQVLLPDAFDGAIIEETNCDDCLIRAYYRGQMVTTTRKKIRANSTPTHVTD